MGRCQSPSSRNRWPRCQEHVHGPINRGEKTAPEDFAPAEVPGRGEGRPRTSGARPANQRVASLVCSLAPGPPFPSLGGRCLRTPSLLLWPLDAPSSTPLTMPHGLGLDRFL